MAEAFSLKVCEIIRAIPPGRVASYGQIAVTAGAPRSARQVARILHSMSRTEGLPWHRVVGGAGTISLPVGGGYELQRKLLEDEGVAFDARGAIDLAVYRWSGPT